MRLHFPSVAVGVVAVSLVLVSMSQGPVDSSSPPRVEYGPHPRDMVQLLDGVPYVVPTGKLFVLTAIGSTTGQSSCTLHVNGQAMELNSWISGGAVPISIHPVPTGFTVMGGSTIVLNAPQFPGTGRAWGYLSKQ